MTHEQRVAEAERAIRAAETIKLMPYYVDRRPFFVRLVASLRPKLLFKKAKPVGIEITGNADF